MLDVVFIPDGTLLVFSIVNKEVASNLSLNAPTLITTTNTSIIEPQTHNQLTDSALTQEKKHELINMSDMSLNSNNSNQSSIQNIAHKKESMELIEFLDVQSNESDQDEYASQNMFREETSKIDELQLRSGMERTIEVLYQPSREPMDNMQRSSKLSKKTFKFIITFTKQGGRQTDQKIIQCKARTCSSFVEVLPKVLLFGESNVKEIKSATLSIKNLSDLPTSIEVRFISKILSAVRGEIIIPANSSIEPKLELFPLKVNPDYRKQVTIVNLLNRENDQVIEVKSANIDQQKVLSFLI